MFGVPSSQPITAIKRDPKAEMCADGAVVMLAMIRAMLNQVDMGQKNITKNKNIYIMFYLTHCGLVMPYDDIALVNISSANGLLPEGSKPLPEPMSAYHQSGSVTFI